MLEAMGLGSDSVLSFPGPPAKQSAVIRRGRMHWSRRAAAEIVDGFDEGVQQPALEAESHQQRHENRRKENCAADLSHGVFKLSCFGSCEAAQNCPMQDEHETGVDSNAA